MPGFRDGNFRGGDLAEGLGLELLRRFSFVAPVPRPEDVGLDAFCTLIRPEGRRLFAEATFGVQIKTASTRKIDLTLDQYKWYAALDLPLFLMSVDLRLCAAELRTMLSAFSTQPFQPEVVLTLDAPAQGERLAGGGLVSPAGTARFWLGEPVLAFTAEEAGQADFPARAHERLAPWLKASAVARRARAVGVHQIFDLDHVERPRLVAAQSHGASVQDVLREISPALFQLATVLNHAFGDPTLREEVRAIARFMRSRGVEPVGIYEDSADPPLPPPAPFDDPRWGRVLVSWAATGSPLTPLVLDIVPKELVERSGDGTADESGEKPA